MTPLSFLFFAIVFFFFKSEARNGGKNLSKVRNAPPKSFHVIARHHGSLSHRHPVTIFPGHGAHHVDRSRIIFIAGPTPGSWHRRRCQGHRWRRSEHRSSRPAQWMEAVLWCRLERSVQSCSPVRLGPSWAAAWRLDAERDRTNRSWHQTTSSGKFVLGESNHLQRTLVNS